MLHCCSRIVINQVYYLVYFCYIPYCNQVQYGLQLILIIALVESSTCVSCLYKQMPFVPFWSEVRSDQFGLPYQYFRLPQIQAYIKACICCSQIRQLHLFFILRFSSSDYKYLLLPNCDSSAVQKFGRLTPYHRLHKGLLHPC